MTDYQCENAKAAKAAYEAREREEKHMRFMCAALTGLLLYDSGKSTPKAIAEISNITANACMKVLDDAKGGDDA